ncbi:MAG: TlpA family protein disulfide reductase [Chitinophagales bacterium]|nr:TlpA family protein disulfide reductase [Chitinophagales bacterium]MDW8419945.1 TlpA disulfide reductase family protein [Chitinophagales bacterium]
MNVQKRISFVIPFGTWIELLKPQIPNTMKNLLFLIGVLSALAMSAQSGEKHTADKIMGEKYLPSLELSDMYGKKINVADFGKSGKITLFSFWATWCGPCKKELSNLAELKEEWEKKYNMQFVAVSIDDSRNVPKVRPYVEGQRWDYIVLLDVNQDLKRSFNIPNVPFTILTDANGKIVYMHNGYTEGDEYVLEEVIQKLFKN